MQMHAGAVQQGPTLDKSMLICLVVEPPSAGVYSERVSAFGFNKV